MRRKRYTLSEARRQDMVAAITALIRDEERVLFAFLYGSFLDGISFRDIDLGVFVENPEKINSWDYECTLSRKIETALIKPFPVETKIINHAPLSFSYYVIRGRLLFVREENAMVDFMTRVARNYLDMAPARRKYMAEAMA